MLVLRLVLAVAAAAMLFLSPASAAPRKLGLVIGIENYDNVKKLKKARSDAEAVAAALKDIGFDEVTFKQDLKRSAFTEVWSEFLDSIKPGDTVAFFYSGHGIELSGQNFLIPSDVPKLQAGRDDRLRRESLSLQEFLTDLRGRRPRFSLLVIDACRENPFERMAFKSLGGEAGLANPEPPEGTFTMYSAGQGEFALDRLSDDDADPNSVYTRRLLPLIKTPGLTLTDIAESVRTDVRALASTVSHVQTPSYYNQLIGKACLWGDTCGVASSVKSVPSMEEGMRLAESRSYDLAINNHFQPLALQGNKDAAVALWQLYDVKLREPGRMLEWLEKAAAMGDVQSAVNMAWANAREASIEHLPRDWQSRLNKSEAKAQAESLLAKAQDEAAIILYTLDEDARAGESSDTTAPQPERRGEVALREAAGRGYAPAMVKYATDIINALPEEDKVGPPEKAKAEEALRLYVEAARKGNARALRDLLTESTGISDTLFKRLDLKIDLSAEEIAGLLPQLALAKPGTGTFDNIRQSADVVANVWETRGLAEELARRQLTGEGFAPSPEAALKTIEEVVEPLLEQERSQSEEGLDTGNIYRLKGRALQELGRTDQALGYFLGTADEYQTYGQSYDVLAAVTLLDRLGWSGQKETEVAKAYDDTCSLLYAADAPSTKDDHDYECTVATRALIQGGRKATFASIKKKIDEFLKPSYGDPPADDPRKALMLFLKGRLGEVDAAELDPGETVERLMNRSAALGNQDALAWYAAKGLPPPKIRAQLEYVAIGAPQYNWEAGQRLQNKAQIACYIATVREGVASPLGKEERRPKLGVLTQEQDGWGIGNVFYDVGVDEAVPGSVRIFIDTIEYKVPASLARQRLRFGGDQKAMIRKLASSDDIRIEFKAGTHAFRDTHSLMGFTDAYKTMIGGCPKAKSVF